MGTQATGGDTTQHLTRCPVSSQGQIPLEVERGKLGVAWGHHPQLPLLRDGAG